MKKSNIIIVGLTIFIIIGLYFLGFGLYPLLNKNISMMTYKEATEESQKIAEKQEKQQNIINNSMTEEEKEEETKTKSEVYKAYEQLSPEEKAKVEVIPKKENVPISKLDEIIKQQEEQKQEEIKKEEDKKDTKEEQEEKKEEQEEKEEEPEKEEVQEEIPRYFDLMDKINIKTRDQGTRGLCWAFGALTSLETHLALKTGKEYDFSRQHVNYLTSNLLYGERVINQGGNFEYFEDYVMQSGVVSEEDVPYDKDYDEKEYSTFLNKEELEIVTDTVTFPTINKYYHDYTDEELETFRTAVKRHIMTNGGLYANINHFCLRHIDTLCYISKYDKDIKDWNYIPDHVVTIIGWDDDYPKENFSYNEGELIPEKDGAYIALNSWGERNYDQKRNVMNGVFYISYEDVYVESDMNGFISTALDEDHAVEFENIKSERIKDEIIEKYNYAIKEKNGKKYITNLVLKRIESLDLSNSDTIYLEDLKYFKNLKNLSLKNCNISSVEQFPELPYLTTLDLSYNNITNIDNLKLGESIVTLNLSHNKIQTINGFDYKYDKGEYGWSEAKIDLSDNNIENIKVYISAENDLNNITNVYVDLHNNQIKDIGNINTNNLVRLSLDASGNKGITGYSDYQTLGDLNLADCDLTTLENVGNIETLNLSGNKNLIFDLSNKYIFSLKLENMDIKSLEDLKIQTSTFNLLDISNNSLQNLNGIPKNITKLNASNNNIQDLSAIADMSLEELNLTNNKIEDLKILNNVKAHTLTLDNNNITTSQIQELALSDETKALSLKNNKIEDVSKMNKSNLQSLDLSQNKGIKGYGKLKVKNILINNCDLKEVEAINSYTESLYIDENNIETLEPLKSGNNLNYLSVRKNTEQLKGNLSSNQKLKTIDLQESPLDSSLKLNNSLENLILSYDYPYIRAQNYRGQIKLINAEITDEFWRSLLDKQAYITIQNATIKYNTKSQNKEIDLKETNLYEHVANLRNLVYVDDGGYITRNREKLVIKKENKDLIKLFYDTRTKLTLEVSFEKNNGILNNIKNIFSNRKYGG